MNSRIGDWQRGRLKEQCTFQPLKSGPHKKVTAVLLNKAEVFPDLSGVSVLFWDMVYSNLLESWIYKYVHHHTRLDFLLTANRCLFYSAGKFSRKH